MSAGERGLCSPTNGCRLVVTALTASFVFDDGNRLVDEITQNPDVQWYLYRNGSGEILRTQDKQTDEAGVIYHAINRGNARNAI